MNKYQIQLHMFTEFTEEKQARLIPAVYITTASRSQEVL